jgi:RNA polymerase sigma-70 factor (ECF subfamily)
MDIHRSLLRRCKEGDLQAFDQLIKQIEQSLYKICYGYTHDKDEALDVLQEVYIKLFRFIDRYDEKLPFLPWAKQVAVRTCLNYHRDNKKHDHLSLDAAREDGRSLLEQVVDEYGNSWENQWAEHELLTRCLQLLPDIYRLEITMHYMDGMSYQEISRILGKPVGTIKSDIFRARKLLMDALRRSGWMEA